jgi:hypothetical protein
MESAWLYSDAHRRCGKGFSNTNLSGDDAQE